MQKRDEAHWQAVVGNFCRHAAKHILKGATFAELRARLTPLIDGILDCIGIPAEARTPGLREAMATMLGMDVWNVTPIPENRFRPRKLNKPERNAPCPCGSGKNIRTCNHRNLVETARTMVRPDHAMSDLLWILSNTRADKSRMRTD